MLANKKLIRLVSILLTAAILLSGCGKMTVSEEPSSSTDNVSSSGFPARMPSFTTKDLDGNIVGMYPLWRMCQRVS